MGRDNTDMAIETADLTKKCEQVTALANSTSGLIVALLAQKHCSIALPASRRAMEVRRVRENLFDGSLY